ncbi:MAG: sigma-70 family RNA polymerase sigma factor [Coriobacteriia bacterium]|nr:sigma-70 family RNA polymerase sigma factor [Coriobacteriia bacterium]
MVTDDRFEAAWSGYGSSVLRYCVYSTGTREAGEDVAAETFARFLAKGAAVPAERTEAWLLTVARNLCASHHRSAFRALRLIGRIVDSPRSEPGSAWRDGPAWEAAQRLSEQQRLTVYLRVVEERPFAEVAELTGKSEAATKMTFYRAMERLRRDVCRERAGGDGSLVGGAEHV